MAPFGFIDDGLGSYDTIDSQGNVWIVADEKGWTNTSEYGDLSYMWEYR
jgi:hypothetical protein